MPKTQLQYTCYGCGKSIENTPLYLHRIATLHNVTGESKVPISRTEFYIHPNNLCKRKADERFCAGFLQSLEDRFVK
jgi:hypothetical protein